MPGDEELGFEAAVAALGKNLLQVCLHPCSASFPVLNGDSSSFQFDAEMEVFAQFDRTRWRILHARVEVSLQSCEKMEGEYGTRTQCISSNMNFSFLLALLS